MKRLMILTVMAVAVLGAVLGCSSSSSSSGGNPNSTNTSAYQGGYTFGYAAGQDGTAESTVLNGVWTLALPVSYACNTVNATPSDASGLPSNEMPPGGTGADAQQWVNGCIAGYDQADISG
jgi:hypothetical protein